MRHALLLLAAAVLMAAMAGCHCCHPACDNCQKAPCPCQNGGGGQAGGADNGAAGAAGAATVTYPYYTVRGPRDFLATNPSSIGP